jgi:hypothetical protein
VSAVWRAVQNLDRLRHGFDSPDAWGPHFAIPSQPAGRYVRAPVVEELRGSFQAIAALAAWFAGTGECGPGSAAALECAEELEAMAHELGRAIDVNETETR